MATEVMDTATTQAAKSDEVFGEWKAATCGPLAFQIADYRVGEECSRFVAQVLIGWGGQTRAEGEAVIKAITAIPRLVAACERALYTLENESMDEETCDELRSVIHEVTAGLSERRKPRRRAGDPRVCQNCGCRRDRHDEDGVCRNVFHLDGGDTCTCTSFKAAGEE